MGKKDDLLDAITEELETWSISDLQDLYDEIAPEEEGEEEESD